MFLSGHVSDIDLPELPPIRDDLRLAAVADQDGDWRPAERLGRFLTAMSPIQSERVTSCQRRKRPGFFGTLQRTRSAHPVWEVQADERVGTLRTTRGGSAKQGAGHGCIAARRINLNEYTRLQGAEPVGTAP